MKILVVTSSNFSQIIRTNFILFPYQSSKYNRKAFLYEICKLIFLPLMSTSIYYYFQPEQLINKQTNSYYVNYIFLELFIHNQVKNMLNFFENQKHWKIFPNKTFNYLQGANWMWIYGEVEEYIYKYQPQESTRDTQGRKSWRRHSSQRLTCMQNSIAPLIS